MFKSLDWISTLIAIMYIHIKLELNDYLWLQHTCWELDLNEYHFYQHCRGVRASFFPGKISFQARLVVNAWQSRWKCMKIEFRWKIYPSSLHVSKIKGVEGINVEWDRFNGGLNSAKVFSSMVAGRLSVLETKLRVSQIMSYIDFRVFNSYPPNFFWSPPEFWSFSISFMFLYLEDWGWPFIKCLLPQNLQLLRSIAFKEIKEKKGGGKGQRSFFRNHWNSLL